MEDKARTLPFYRYLRSQIPLPIIHRELWLQALFAGLFPRLPCPYLWQRRCQGWFKPYLWHRRWHGYLDQTYGREGTRYDLNNIYGVECGMAALTILMAEEAAQLTWKGLSYCCSINKYYLLVYFTVKMCVWILRNKNKMKFPCIPKRLVVTLSKK